MVDSADRDRVAEARQELHKIVSDREMRDAVILIFANKQDQKDALKPDALRELLGLGTLKDRTWYIQPCSAIKGDGLYEGLVWLSEACK